MFAVMSWATFEFSLWLINYQPTTIDGGDLVGVFILLGFVALTNGLLRQLVDRETA